MLGAGGRTGGGGISGVQRKRSPSNGVSGSVVEEIAPGGWTESSGEPIDWSGTGAHPSLSETAAVASFGVATGSIPSSAGKVCANSGQGDASTKQAATIILERPW